jgi:thioredoxin 2
MAAEAKAAGASILTCPNCGKRNRIGPIATGVPRCANCHQMLPWLVDPGPQGFEAEIAASVPVLVDFWAPWCGPCKWVEPVVADLAKTEAGRLKVVKLNVDDSPEISARYRIQGIPALVLIRDGTEVDRFVGAAGKEQLQAWLAEKIAG